MAAGLVWVFIVPRIAQPLPSAGKGTTNGIDGCLNFALPRSLCVALFCCPTSICLPKGPTSLVSPLLVCMQDKSAGARQVAQECLSVLIGAGTVQPSRVRAGTRDFPPAVMRQLKPALEKILDASGSSLPYVTK